MNRLTGQCLCGLCRYTVNGLESPSIYLCHCSRCRKETGTTHGTNIFFKNAQLFWEKGVDNFTHFKLENTMKQRAFCKTCGSPLPRKENISDVVIPAGTLDNDASLLPTAHIFYSSRASWEDKLIDLKCFDELPK